MLHTHNLSINTWKRSRKSFQRSVVGHYILALCFSLIFHAGTVYSQNSNKVVPPTPVSAQYEKYINYPVNHSTGAAAVEVPLYNVKTKGGIQIPVTLSYHTAGVKPSDPDLPVGLGWVINPGARVTRKIVGYADELFVRAPFTDFPTQVESLDYLENIEFAPPYYSGRWTTYDSEYDIFSYQTGTGVSGRFVIDKQGSEYIAKPLEFSLHKIKLHYVLNFLSNPVFDFIEITDENGTLYRFGKPMSTYTGGNTTESSTSSSALTGWLMTDIVSADKKDVVRLKWQTVSKDGTSMYKQTDIQDVIVLTDKFHAAQPAAYYFGQIGYSINASPPQTSSLSESYSSISTIAGIKYGDEEVKLNYASGYPTLLNNIEIYNGTQKLKQITLHKSTFANSVLRLDSVSFADSGNQTVSKYRFGYHESSQWATSPTRAVDFWGYYNGATGNTSLIPNFSYLIEEIDQFHPTLTQAFTSSNRNSNGNAQALILNSVTYPTGGKTTYEYEVNQIYDAPLNQTFSAGGLRVSKVQHWTQSGSLAETRTYKYGINESGSGDGLPMTADMFVSTTIENSKYHIDDGSGLGNSAFGSANFRRRVFTGNASSTLYTYDYPSTTYRQVTEYIGDPTGNIGKILYEYTPAQYNIRRLYLSNISYNFMDRNWDRPRLSKTTNYKYSSGSYTPVSSDLTKYRMVEVDTLRSWLVRRFANFHTYYLTGVLPNDEYDFENDFHYYFPDLPEVFDTSPITLYRTMMAPDSVKHTDYFPSGSITISKAYGYSGNNLLYTRSVTNQESSGDTKISTFTYPIDYSSTQPYTRMIDSNIVAPVIEQTEYKNSISSGNFLQSTMTDYAFWANDIAVTSPTSLIYPQRVWSKKGNPANPYEIRSWIMSYGNDGRVQEVHEKWTGPATSYLWGYNREYPIAEAKNAKINEIYHNNFEDATDFPGGYLVKDNMVAHTGDYSGKIVNPNSGEQVLHSNTWLQVNLGGVAKKFRYSGWVYSNGPSSEILLFMKRPGETGYYSYVDWMGTSEINKWVYLEKEFTVPADVSQLNLRLDNNSAGTVWFDDLRIAPADAQVTTFTYKPLIGTSSATDNQGITTYYDYDSYQRLMNVKDKDGKIIKHMDYQYKQ
jgi:hypothetical protein